MIVTTGRIIKVDAYQDSSSAVRQYQFEKTAEAPGVVQLRITERGKETVIIPLPGNPRDAQEVITAYLRAVNEDVGYREVTSE